MKARLLIGLVVGGLIGLGAWLWSRNGLAVWLDAAIAFCA